MLGALMNSRRVPCGRQQALDAIPEFRIAPAGGSMNGANRSGLAVPAPRPKISFCSLSWTRRSSASLFVHPTPRSPAGRRPPSPSRACGRSATAPVASAVCSRSAPRRSADGPPPPHRGRPPPSAGAPRPGPRFDPRPAPRPGPERSGHPLPLAAALDPPSLAGVFDEQPAHRLRRDVVEVGAVGPGDLGRAHDPLIHLVHDGAVAWSV